MSYIPGDIYYKLFTVNNISGYASNADSLPGGLLNNNCVDDYSASAHVYVTNIDTGRYAVSGYIPASYSVGNSINLSVSGYVGGGLTKTTFDLGVLSPIQHGLSYNVEPNLTVNQLLGLMGAVICGSSVISGNQITYYAVENNSTSRITSTAVSGARQFISYNTAGL